METFIAASHYCDSTSDPYIKKIVAKNLEEAKIAFLKSFYFAEDYCKEKGSEIKLEDLEEIASDTFCYSIKNIKDL